MGVLLGWTSSILFSVCALPQVLKAIKEKNADGLSKVYLAMWLGGVLTGASAVLLEYGFVPWLLAAQVPSGICALILLYYRFRPSR